MTHLADQLRCISGRIKMAHALLGVALHPDTDPMDRRPAAERAREILDTERIILRDLAGDLDAHSGDDGGHPKMEI